MTSRRATRASPLYVLSPRGLTVLADRNSSQTIHVPDDLFPVASDAAQEVYSEWLAKLQTFLDASIDTRNVSLLWSLNQTAPGHDQDFQDYLGEVGFQLEWWYQWNTAIEPFQEKYANTYDNRTAYINPTPKVRLDHYKNQTQATFDEARKRQLEFKEFFTTEVLKPDEDSCTTGLWVVPTNAGLVNPIDSYPYTAPTVNETALSFSSFYYSVFSSGGEVVIPSTSLLRPLVARHSADPALQLARSLTSLTTATTSSMLRLLSTWSRALGATTSSSTSSLPSQTQDSFTRSRLAAPHSRSLPRLLSHR